MRNLFTALIIAMLWTTAGHAQDLDDLIKFQAGPYGLPSTNRMNQTNQTDGSYLGNLSANPFLYESTANPFGAESPKRSCLSGLSGLSGLSRGSFVFGTR